VISTGTCRLLIENEKSLLTFEIRSSREQLRTLISNDFREIGASGTYLGFNEVLEDLPHSAENWSAISQNFECHELSDNIVQVIYRCKIIHDYDDEPVYSLRSSIWRIEDGHWKMVFHQGTRVKSFQVIP